MLQIGKKLKTNTIYDLFIRVCSLRDLWSEPYNFEPYIWSSKNQLKSVTFPKRFIFQNIIHFMNHVITATFVYYSNTFQKNRYNNILSLISTVQVDKGKL